MPDAPDPGRRNERTRYVDPSFRSTLAAVEHSFESALFSAEVERARAPQGWALLVVATWLDELGTPQLRSWLRRADGNGPIAVSVGAHTEADVGPIHGASLRHLLMIADPDRRGATLDVIDLHTPGGFRADGQDDVRRVESTTAQRVGVGSGDLVALVLRPGELVHDAWRRAESGAGLELHGPRPVRDGLALELRARAFNCDVSVAIPYPDQRRRHPPTAEGVARVEVTTITPQRMIVTPTAAQLNEGFLIGRDDRCAIGGQDSMLSRVHAYVRGRGDGLLVCDVGSTNGTWVIDGDTELGLDRGHRARVVGAAARLRCGESIIDVVRS